MTIFELFLIAVGLASDAFVVSITLGLKYKHLNIFNKLKIDKNLPYIIVYTDGKITATYSISKNNYNPKKVIKYLNRIGATDID